MNDCLVDMTQISMDSWFSKIYPYFHEHDELMTL